MTKSAFHKQKDFLAAIGRVTINFAALERRLHWLAWFLIGGNHPEVPPCTTVDLSFGKLVRLVGSLHLVREKDQAVTDELSAILTRAYQVEEKRNTITHSDWGSTSESLVRFKARAKGQKKKSKALRWDLEKITVDQIEDVARLIEDVTADLDSFTRKRKYNFSSKPEDET